MKNVNRIISCSLILLFISSCADVYYSPDSRTLAANHNSIAILPPKVSIAAKKNVDADALKEQQKTESTNFQQEMYNWLLKRKMNNGFAVEIQDVATTNAKLKQAGYFNEDVALTPNEIAKILGVDAILTSNYALSKPMSEGAAIAIGLLVGVWGATNETTVALQIHDNRANKLIWNYNHTLSGSIGSSPARLVDNLMRNASRKMPYTLQY